MSTRIERNYKMANAASPNTTLPSSKSYRDGWDYIFRRKKATAVGESKNKTTRGNNAN